MKYDVGLRLCPSFTFWTSVYLSLTRRGIPGRLRGALAPALRSVCIFTFKYNISIFIFAYVEFEVFLHELNIIPT